MKDLKYKQDARIVLETLLPELEILFQGVSNKLFGKPFKHLNILNVNSVQIIGSRGFQLVSATFKCEHGPFMANLSFKELKSNSEALQYADSLEKLTRKLVESKTMNIRVPRVLKIVDNYLIFVGFTAKTYLESDLPENEKLRFAGELLATFHGDMWTKVKLNYTSLINRLVDKLPVPQERKEKLLSIAQKPLNEINSSWGGTMGFGNFDKTHLMFSPKGTIGYIVDPLYEDQLLVCRLEDAANFFRSDAIDEWFKTGESLSKTLEKWQHFKRGYDMELSRFGISLSDTYSGKNDSIFYFHLGLSALLEANFLISQYSGKLSEESLLDRLSKLVGMVRFCWLNSSSF
ncbi:MAG: hypothetical protein ACTSRU_03385 [Candidatus Hodarchaeales archaeon]